jgi:hypothetical protein
MPTSLFPTRSKSAPRVERIDLKTIHKFEEGEKIASRRSMELLAHPQSFKIFAAFGARRLTPGEAFFVEGISDLLRVESIKIQQLSGLVEITAHADFYAIPSSTFAAESSGAAPIAAQPAVPDLAQALLEIPAALASGRQAVLPLRIRDNSSIRFADMHLSRAGSTYERVSSDTYASPGGELTSALLSSDDHYLAQGPTFDALGPDIADALDLSSNLEEWRYGKQVCLIGSELFFLQKITALGGTSYRLDGLLRARYNTVRGAHSIGAKVYLFSEEFISPIEDALLQPALDLFVKIQPVANSALSLASITAVSIEPLYGLGVRPEPVQALLPSSPYAGSACYSSGDDVSLEWVWFALEPSPYSGAGQCNFGGPAGTSPLPGKFVLEIRTLADAVVRTEDLLAPSYTYTNANLVSDLGSEVGFKVVVVHQVGGFVSSETSLTVAKI